MNVELVSYTKSEIEGIDNLQELFRIYTINPNPINANNTMNNVLFPYFFVDSLFILLYIILYYIV